MVSTEMIIYIGMTLIGFGFLLISFLGGGDSDTGGDAGHEVGGHDVAGMDSPGLSALSLPMISSFLATAGSTGALFTSSGTDSVTTALYAIAVGVLVFLGGFVFVAKFLVAAQSSTTVHEKEYEGKTGVVTETIPPEGLGAVAVTVRGVRMVVSAKGAGSKVPIGTEVFIKRVVESIAQVEVVKSG